MADFFDKSENQEKNVSEEGQQEEEKQVAEEAASEKIKIGEEEFEPDQLKEIVDGYKDIEKKYGGLGKLESDWGRKAQRIGELQKELDSIKGKKLDEKTQTGQQLTPEEQREILRNNARVLGIPLMEDVQQLVREEVVKDREAAKLLKECEDLEKEIDGSDGIRPAFNSKDILEYMQDPGVPKNPLKAYKDKYEDKWEQWRDAELRKGTPAGLQTEEKSIAGRKEPSKVKMTNDNLMASIKESLYGGR